MIAGLYDRKDDLIYTWKELIEKGIIEVNSKENELERCNIKNENVKLIIDENINRIHKGTFCSENNFDSLYIPKTVNNLYINYFGTANIKEIIVDPENSNYSSEDGVLFNKDKTELIKYPAQNLRTDYKIPNTVKVIGYKALYGAENLKILDLSTELIHIDENAFENSTQLTEISVGNKLTRIGRQSFRNTNITNFYVPKSVTIIDKTCFWCSGIKNIEVDKKNEYFSSENGVLFNKNKTELIIYPAKKEDVIYNVPETVETIGESAFTCTTYLEEVKMKENVKKIKSNAFFSSSIKKIKIPEKVETLENHVFGECKNLEEITFSKKTKEIQPAVLLRCSDTLKVNYTSKHKKLKKIKGYEHLFDGNNLTKNNIKCTKKISSQKEKKKGKK